MIKAFFGVDKSTQHFFDTVAMAQVERDKKDLLGSMGALVRKIARSSIKTRKWKYSADISEKSRAQPNRYTTYWKGTAITSPSGSPPFGHTSGWGLKKSILFAYDEPSDSVIVGPEIGKWGDKDVPYNLEFGGSTTITIPGWAKAYKEAHNLPLKGRVQFNQRIRKRPFMKPALDKAVGTYPELFRDSLLKG